MQKSEIKRDENIIEPYTKKESSNVNNINSCYLSKANLSKFKNWIILILDSSNISNSQKLNTIVHNNNSSYQKKIKKSILEIDNFNNEQLKQSKNDKHIHFGIYFSWRYFCCKNHLKKTNPSNFKKVSIYETANSYLLERLDITYYLKLVSQHKKLKESLFNKRQRYCIEFVDKPNLYNDDIFKSVQNNLHTVDSKRVQKIVDYFDTKKDSLSDVDKRLLKLLPRELQQLIIS